VHGGARGGWNTIIHSDGKVRYPRWLTSLLRDVSDAYPVVVLPGAPDGQKHMGKHAQAAIALTISVDSYIMYM